MSIISFFQNMSFQTVLTIEIIGSVFLIYIAHRVSRKLKKRRLFKQCYLMQHNVNMIQAKKFLRFLKWYTLAGIKTPDVAYKLVETQKIINASPDITNELKRRIYRQLKRKRVIDSQEVIRYYVDKDGKRVY